MTYTPGPGSPRWMRFAHAKIGVRETPGAANNSVIMRWAANVGSKALGIVYGADSVPWCGLYVAEVMREAGLKGPPISVRAMAWAKWGDECSPGEGAILVFGRQGGGHVGFYAGETDQAFLVLGGNQSDSVNLTWISKDRLVSVRWPSGERQTGLRIKFAAAGVLSTNEA